MLDTESLLFMDKEIIIAPDSTELCHRAAQRLVALIQANAREGRPFHISLAGGTTPKALYQLLARSPYVEEIPWDHVRIFFGDERMVPPDHPDSNFRMANEALFSHVPLNTDQIHRIKTELGDPREAANHYDQLLERALPRDDQGISQFDLVLLGLGPDGHVASLFPGTDILDLSDRRAAAVWVERLNTWRISITFPLINHARNVWLFVAGEGKADIVGEVLGKPREQARYPVEMIQPKGLLSWYLDQAAAARLHHPAE